MSNAAAFSIGNGGCTPTNGVVSPQLTAVSDEHTDIGYGRVSTLAEAQTSSIESQEERLKNHGCIEFHADRLSGGDFDRPGLLAAASRAIDLAKVGVKVRFWVTTPDRIGRDAIEWISLVGRLEKEGVEVWSLDSGQITISTPGDKLMWTLLSATYEFFLNLTKSKIRAAAAKRRNEGRKMGGVPPLGYCWNASNTQLQPHPGQWEIARMVVGQYLDGEGLGTITTWLWDEHQIEYSDSGLLRWLKSPVLLGVTEHRQIDGVKLPVPLKIPNTHTPLISWSEYVQLEYRFALNQYFPPGKTIRACVGLCRCIDCKRSLEVQPQKRVELSPYVFFRCRGVKPKGRKSERKKCPNSGIVQYERVEPVVLQAICTKAEEIARAALEPDTLPENPRIITLQSQLEVYQQLQDQHGRPELDTIIQNVRSEIAYLQSHTTELQAEDNRLSDLIKAMAAPQYWQGLPDSKRHQIYYELGVVVWCKGREIVKAELGFQYRHWRKRK